MPVNGNATSVLRLHHARPRPARRAGRHQTGDLAARRRPDRAGGAVTSPAAGRAQRAPGRIPGGASERDGPL